MVVIAPLYSFQSNPILLAISDFTAVQSEPFSRIAWVIIDPLGPDGRTGMNPGPNTLGFRLEMNT